MDNLKALWNNLKEDTNEMTDLSKSEIQFTINQKSKGIMKTLTEKVFQKLLFCSFFAIAIGVLIPFASPLPAQVLLLILLAAYIIGAILLYQEHKALKNHIDVSSNMIENIKIVRERIKSMLKYEQLVGLVIYPISIAAGFMLGLSAGRADGTYMDRTSDWLVLIVAMLVIIPIAHFGSKKMNKKAFGKFLDKLENNIVELEKIES